HHARRRTLAGRPRRAEPAVKARRCGFPAASTPSGGTRYRAPLRPALPAGALYAMVLAHLRAHPDLDFTPGELARALGRPNSRGAIIKLCWRLVEENLAVRTQA